MSVGLVFDRAMMKHESVAPHPEQPARISTIFEALEEAGVASGCVATRKQTIVVLFLRRCGG